MKLVPTSLRHSLRLASSKTLGVLASLPRPGTAFLLALLVPLSVHAAEGVPVPKQEWSFEGIRAKWNKDEIYRGYQVFTGLCLSCHSAKYISHRDLMRVGFTEAEVQALARELDMTINDKLISGLAPEDAVGSYGKVPPDLSLINKARAGLANYTYALLVGYTEDPATVAEAFPEGVPQGAHYNAYFPGHAIAMPNPIAGADAVTYHDETPATVQQMAKDVTTFLQWTAEPERIDRQRLGVFVVLYLLIFAVVAYFTKRAIWKDVH